MMEKLIKKLNNRKGFTLIELIVVIAIIGILAAILIPQFTGFSDKANQKAVLAEARSVATAIDSMVAEGQTPTAASAAAIAGIPSSGAITGTITDKTFTYTASNGWKVDRLANGTFTTPTK